MQNQNGIVVGGLLGIGLLVPAAVADPVLPGYSTGGGCTARPDYLNPAPFCCLTHAGGADSYYDELFPPPYQIVKGGWKLRNLRHSPSRDGCGDGLRGGDCWRGG